ncbi:hypothetical protein FBEOM_12842 [Fusarium beomiforme]|uniref:Uncharacterized protein n=1 Tax=Fusarium beomiforme TaxID=44412 RepID=A0A9P5DSM7_9HYPO|nr:hypothetical protein FBEOM_12842 [Fusarium beomiforme]
MAEGSGTRPTKSPYASGEEAPDKSIAAELSTALRVYVATDILSLPALRDMTRAEIVRLGGKLHLPALIKVMEKSALSFDAHPGIAAYVESRALSFSQDVFPPVADDALDEVGVPDTLSKVLLRSIVLSKASESRQMEEPSYNFTTSGYPALELRPAEDIMKQAEEQAFKKAETSCEDEELRQLKNKKERRRGKFRRKDQKRLDILLCNQQKRALEKLSEKQLAASRLAELGSRSLPNSSDIKEQSLPTNRTMANRRTSNSFRTSSESLEGGSFERYVQFDDDPDRRPFSIFSSASSCADSGSFTPVSNLD